MKNRILKISVLVIMIIVSVFALSGCTETVGNEQTRFIHLSYEGIFSIYYDSKTKVMYAVSEGYYNRGNVTVLVDAEGKPLLYND